MKQLLNWNLVKRFFDVHPIEMHPLLGRNCLKIPNRTDKCVLPDKDNDVSKVQNLFLRVRFKNQKLIINGNTIDITGTKISVRLVFALALKKPIEKPTAKRDIGEPKCHCRAQPGYLYTKP